MRLEECSAPNRETDLVQGYVDTPENNNVCHQLVFGGVPLENPRPCIRGYLFVLGGGG